MNTKYDYKLDNMKLTELYERDMTNVLYMIYKDKFDKSFLNKIVKKEIDTNYLSAIGNTRNIYKNEFGTFDINDILKFVYDNDYIIGSNGSFTINPEIDEAPTSILLLDFIAKRKIEKNLAIQFEKEGRFEEAKFKDDWSNTLKIYTNSGYGIQLMVGSFLYNCDSASIITGQARELISEMMWSTEKFLRNNMVFSDLNEILLYIHSTTNMPFDESYMKYIDFIPDTKTLIEWYNVLVDDIQGYNKYIVSFKEEIYRMFKNMNEKERILFYYKNNFLEFILKNKKVQDLFYQILHTRVEFYDPYKIPTEFAEQFAEIVNLFDNFVINPIPTYDRVNKYLTRKRRTVLLSDTDSVMPNLNAQYQLFVKLFPNIDFNDELITFKTINVITNLCTRVCDVGCIEFAKICNVPDKYINRINMKNEFYFQRLIMYSQQKKNYSARKRMREGQLIPDAGQIANTGLALKSSTLNPQVSEMINKILEEDILKAKEINPINILNRVAEIENFIRQELKSGNKTFGLHKKFSGEENYKDVETTNIARMSMIWNRLYPQDPIQAGDVFYAFKTSIEKPEDCKKINDPMIRDRILDLVFDIENKHIKEFKNQDFRRFGLKEIGIPRTGEMKRIPDWLIPFINIEDLVVRHTSSIVALFPSICIKRSKVDSTKYIKSSMIAF